MRLSSTSNRRRGRSVNARGLSLGLCLSLLLTAAAMPAGTRGQEGSDGANDAASSPATQRGAKGARFVPGEALVRFRDEAAAESAERLGAEIVVEDQIGAVSRGRARARVERFGGEGIVPGLRLARVDAARTLESIAALNARPDVLYAEPNFYRYLMTTPNDPKFTDGTLYGLNKINAPTAWETTRGSESVVVGVVDQGIDINHPDLAANIWVNPGDSTVDGVDNDNNGRIDDTNGWDFADNNRTVYDPGDSGCDGVCDSHGTHVSGTIGAVGNNGVGVVGVNWNVKLMSLKIFSPGTNSAAQIAAYSYAAMMRNRFVSTNGAQGANVRVLNNSYGGGGSEQSELDAIRALNDAGILFVASAGNDNRDNFSFPTFPANYDSPNVIAVAATNSADGRSSFSSFSSRLVSIGAPGSSILSTTPNSTYSTFSGTSMSSPHVAGSAALLLSVAPDISVQNLRGALAFTGDRIGSLTNVTTTGRRLNVANALAAAIEPDTTAPAARTLSVTAQAGRSVTLGWTAPGDDGTTGAPAADYDFVFVNGSTGERTVLPSGLQPAAPGVNEAVVLDLPYRSFGGTVEMRAYDNRGNFSTSAVAVSVPVNQGSDPYIVSTFAAQPLSADGTNIGLNGDDRYQFNRPLPFAFPFYGQNRSTVTVSTNGVLYFSAPPVRDNGDADDVPSSVAGLQGQTMIAGLWDDNVIDTAARADAGIFVVQPDANHVIFRWQGTTFPTPLSPTTNRGVHHVNFEIELRSDGAIVTRYGAGNTNLFPVVGISGGEPAAYNIASHTSENALTSLTNAPTVIFAPRPAGPPPPIFGFQQLAGATVSEAAGRATLSVVRAGDSTVAASVSVRTNDNAAAVRCDDKTTVPNVAFARCDYATTVNTLNFAAGETSKSFDVPLINDAHAEPNEDVQLSLFNPSAGAAIGVPGGNMTLTITSDDAAGAANPVNDSSFFVRQQYLDFLSREPDTGGFNAWLGVLNGCANPFNTDRTSASAACDRNLVSSSFFRSAEFEIKGRYVFNFYTLSFNRLPLYSEIIPDMASVTGATEAEVYQKKAAFTANWVTRPEFQTAYGALSNQAFVDTLLGRYSLAAVTTPDPATPDANQTITLTRADLVNRLGASSMTRAQVVRAIADSNEVSAAEFRRAFVAMQYFGYLRRDPEEPGYTNWLLYLNANPNDFYTMVNGFANSGEYRLRFGPQ